MARPIHAVFLSNVKRRLRELGMTQRDLAVEMGWTEAYVSQILAGRNVPKMDMPDKICKPLQTTALYLLTPVDSEEPEKISV